MDESMTEPPMTLSIWTKCTHTLETEENTFDSFPQHSSVENLKERKNQFQIKHTFDEPKLGFVSNTYVYPRTVMIHSSEMI